MLKTVTFLIRLVSLMSLVSVLAGQALADEAAGDTAQIRQLLLGTFDKPDAPLSAEPIVVVAEHAIADWTQGDTGGRALLHKKDGKWTIALCGGDALKEADFLVQAGVPPTSAAQLAAQLSDAERHVAPERIAQLARFDGVVVMGGAQP